MFFCVYFRLERIMRIKILSKQLSILLSLALVFAMGGERAEAASARKASLAVKSFRLSVGQKKKITIKKKKKGAKYTFQTSSKKVAKVNKKGVVTGKKAGKAKIAVKEKYKSSKKKKTRKVGVVKVTVKARTVKADDKLPSGSQTTTGPLHAEEPTSTATPTATATATMTATPLPDGDVYAKELFCVTVNDTKKELVNGNTCNVEMQYFKGSAAGTYFTGNVYKESSSVKKTYTDGRVVECARYMLSGKDDTGTSCKIFIQDDVREENGKIISNPVILTNSKSLAWMETADIQGRIFTDEAGTKKVSYRWNESNTEKKQPPAVVRPDTSHKYTKEIFTFFIDIGATDSITGKGGKASMIHFSARGECENFNGKTVADSVDTRLKFTGMIETLSARYIMEGTDSKGNPCRVYVENNGIDNNGMVTEPIIITDCPDYAWMETAPLHGTVSWETGLTIHVWTTEDAE